MMYRIVISCDPGVSGGISILDGQKRPKVYKMPVHNVVVNKKNKKEYDLGSIFEILSPYGEFQDVLFVQEKVSSMPGEGSVSSFGFGKSAGLTIGIAVGLGFKVVEVSPITWKKGFPELITDSIMEKKQEIKDLRLVDKTLKDKQLKKQNKKNIDRLNRQIKSEAKSAARELVSKKYLRLADQLKKKNTDGMAESLLIALYGREHQNELV
jgi:hypothetical protein